MKKIKLLIVALLISLIFTIPAQALGGLTTYNTPPLTSSQQSDIDRRLDEASELTGVEIYIWYFKGSKYDRQPTYTNKDAIYLVICENDTGFGDKYYYDIYTYGSAHGRLSDSDIDYILDHSSVYNNIKAGRIYEGISGFITVCTDTLGTVSQNNAKVILIALAVSLIIGAVAVAIVVYTYKRKLKSPSYPLSKYAALNLTYHSDTFIGKNVTRVKIQNSSGGSGGRGGGGGGHRGGR